MAEFEEIGDVMAEVRAREDRRWAAMRRRSFKALEAEGWPTLAEMATFESVDRGDVTWDTCMREVLEAARRGLDVLASDSADECRIGELVWDTKKGAVLIDELVRIAWEYRAEVEQWEREEPSDNDPNE
ncbi:MAG TPA: hypothetical protein VE338_16635 [Ktedonobacterales bacterium]|jgi:hypothetical protein|nr:hypothetical protein [Ktedonobacterales bacterium]